MSTPRFALVIVLAAVSILPGCARNPVTGKRQLALISEEQEIAMGREAHPEILSEFGRVERDQLQNYVDGVGQKLAVISHRPRLQWHFTVVDEPVVNAFALPGGYIYLTRGILAYMNNEAEMAGVLGHEIGHVTARHAVTQLSKSQLLGAGLGVGSLLSPTFRQLGNLAEFGAGLLLLKYSRDDERQSDELGVRYMAQAGYDPRALGRFFEVFERMREQSASPLPGWLSSHPSPPDRIAETEQLARQVMSESAGRDWNLRRQQLLLHLEGLVFGDNPREGFVSQNRFYHPQLRFQLHFPANWKVQNSKNSALFVEPGQQAAIELSLPPVSAGTTPKALASSIAARSGIRQISGRELEINGNPAYLGLFQVRSAQGQDLKVMAAFISWNQRLYQLAGLSPATAFDRFASTFQESLLSFEELRDARMLSVSPDRIRLHTVAGNETLRQIHRSAGNPRVSLEDLSLLNRIDPDRKLEPGSRVKIVAPGRRIDSSAAAQLGGYRPPSLPAGGRGRNGTVDSETDLIEGH